MMRPTLGRENSGSLGRPAPRGAPPRTPTPPNNQMRSSVAPGPGIPRLNRGPPPGFPPVGGKPLPPPPAVVGPPPVPATKGPPPKSTPPTPSGPGTQMAGSPNQRLRHDAVNTNPYRSLRRLLTMSLDLLNAPPQVKARIEEIVFTLPQVEKLKGKDVLSQDQEEQMLKFLTLVRSLLGEQPPVANDFLSYQPKPTKSKPSAPQTLPPIPLISELQRHSNFESQAQNHPSSAYQGQGYGKPQTQQQSSTYYEGDGYEEGYEGDEYYEEGYEDEYYEGDEGYDEYNEGYEEGYYN